MSSVSGPISNMMSKLLGFIRNLLAATVIIVIGVFLARVFKELFTSFFISVSLYKWINKVFPIKNTPEHAREMADAKLSLSQVLGNIIYLIVLIPIVTIALEVLNIKTISEPIQSVLNS